jgi:hypothetical protein
MEGIVNMQILQQNVKGGEILKDGDESFYQ